MCKEKEPHEKHKFKLGKKGIIGLLLGLLVVLILGVTVFLNIPREIERLDRANCAL